MKQDLRRAPRNKTITLTENDIAYYWGKCLRANEVLSVTSIADSIFCGDVNDVLPSLPDSFVDLAIIDPPYNLNKRFGEKRFSRMNFDEYRSYTLGWLLPLKRLLKPRASLYICSDWFSSLIIAPVLREHFFIQNRITWQREKGRGSKRNWKNSMEDIWFATVCADQYIFNAEAVKMRRKVVAPYRENGKPKDWIESGDGNFRDTFSSNFWNDICVPYWSMPENTDHPTQKPEKLMAKLILASSNPGDTVFDPFCGSGTTAVTAKKLQRHYVGIELDKNYCALAQKRLKDAEKDGGIQGFCDGVFWDRNTHHFMK